MHYSLGEKINDEVKEQLEKIKKIIHETKCKPVFISFDDDRGSQSWHRETFKKYEHLILEGKSIVEIIYYLGHLYMWPISDLLHLLKNERDKSMNSDLYSDENSNHININSFKSIFSLKETTNDKSEIGTTKDSYVMDLFSIKTTIKSLIDENFSNVAFVLPFNLIIPNVSTS